MVLLSTTVRMANVKKTKITSASEDVEKREPLINTVCEWKLLGLL
jgi:hypothetical protein